MQNVGQNKQNSPIHPLSPLLFKPTVQVGQAKTNNPMVPQLTIPTALILLFAIAISVYSQGNILQPPSKREHFTITTTISHTMSTLVQTQLYFINYLVE